MPGQAHYLVDPMHMIPGRVGYPRDMYALPPPHNTATYMRDRGISSYPVPDPRVRAANTNVVESRILSAMTGVIFDFTGIL